MLSESAWDRRGVRRRLRTALALKQRRSPFQNFLLPLSHHNRMHNNRPS